MSVFNNIPAFNGLGKASLKLDFETETQLKDFARRYIVDEGDETPDNDPDPEKAAKAIINNLYRRTTGDAYMKPHKGGVDGPGDVYIITDTRSKAKKELDEIKALQKYDVQKFNKEALKDIEEGDPLLYEQLKSDLDGYGDVYKVTDLRQRGRKEPGEIRSNKNLDFEIEQSEKIYNLNRELYDLEKSSTRLNLDDKLKRTDYYRISVNYNPTTGIYYVNISYFNPRKLRRDLQPPTFSGYTSELKANIDFDKVSNFRFYEGSKVYGTGYITKKYFKELFNSVLKEQLKMYKKQIADFKTSSWRTEADLKEIERNLKYFIQFYSNPEKYNIQDMNGYGLAYLKERAKLADISADTTLGVFSLGETANNEIYNNLDILEFNGMQPTYKQLPDYDQFFKPAEHKNSFAGFGLDDTKELIADICRKHYKECAGIAAHLKGKTLLQSCFNLWHWLHHNIRYEYDRDGREEVRTPLRVWADRKRGVDCDCLSVFAWCVLKCMGYNPVFELVAFNGKKNLSHIFINCDGVVVDRVWFVFNQRPPRVTKREIYEVKLLQNLGQLF